MLYFALFLANGKKKAGSKTARFTPFRRFREELERLRNLEAEPAAQKVERGEVR
jgi:hypothetical protein